MRLQRCIWQARLIVVPKGGQQAQIRVHKQVVMRCWTGQYLLSFFVSSASCWIFLVSIQEMKVALKLAPVQKAMLGKPENVSLLAENRGISRLHTDPHLCLCIICSLDLDWNFAP